MNYEEQPYIFTIQVNGCQKDTEGHQPEVPVDWLGEFHCLSTKYAHHNSIFKWIKNLSSTLTGKMQKRKEGFGRFSQNDLVLGF